MYRRIVDLAKQDAVLWRSGIDPQRGYLQITTEFLPARAEQLNRYAATCTSCVLQHLPAVVCSRIKHVNSVLSHKQLHYLKTAVVSPLVTPFRQYSEPNGSYPLLPTSQSEQATVYFRRCELRVMCLMKEMHEHCVCLRAARFLENAKTDALSMCRLLPGLSTTP